MPRKHKDTRPITDSIMLKKFLDKLKSEGEMGERNYAIFQTGKVTCLRVSDVLALKKDQVFDKRGRVKKEVFTKDKKTKKQNRLYLTPVRDVLEDYYEWLQDYEKKHPYKKLASSEWLFPSSRYLGENKPIAENTYYRICHKIGLKLGVDWIGSHTMRKTGAFIIYEQTGHNIGFVSHLLNNSSEAMTFRYLGFEEERKEALLDQINFNRV